MKRLNKDELKTKNSSKKIRKGDIVVVIAGEHKGQQGKVLSVEADKVVVENINLCKRHVKRSQQRPKGGVDSFEKPVHISNIRLVVNGEPVKLATVFKEDGERVYVVKSKEDKKGEVVYRPVKKSAS